ncbi:MAG: TIGR03086 family metal-binding protein [Acidimicrobiales bacterium]
MNDLVQLYRRAVDQFGARVAAVGGDQWDQPTPCADWNVRELVNHVVGENAWALPLFEGATIAEVGDQLDGDLLGEDPVVAWKERAEPAVAAAGEEGALERIVHVSFGDIPGREYVSQVTTDHVIHAWDLARGAGGDERLDPELVEFAYAYLEPQVEGWRAAGAFGPKLDLPEDSGLQDRLLALTGRQP